MALDSHKRVVFLDNTKKRKWYFRAGTVTCFVFLLAAISLFAFGLYFTANKNKPLSYENAIEKYHYYYSGANHKKIALTFDDGPNPPITQEIQEILKKTNTPATFFFVGKNALIRPDIVKETAKNGFDVQVHSFTHSFNSHSSYNRMALELSSSSFLLSQITGKDTKLYRPPYLLGIGVDPTVNPYIPLEDELLWSMQLGYLPVGSDIDTRDWLAQTPEDVIENLNSALKAHPNGHIVLLHDDRKTTAALEGMISHLRDEGYRIVPLAELLEPPSVVALSKTLTFGDTDATTDGEVSKLQWFLYTHKYLDPYALSGVFDTGTKEALATFQADAKITTADPNAAGAGIAGPMTRELILTMTKDSAEESALAATVLDVWGANVRSALGNVVLAAYINLFPIIRNGLIIMVGLTLVLVIVRTLGILSLFIYRWWADIKGPESDGSEEGVSILIPAYNEQENIAATVESVISSSYYPREVIVIDDGSQDNTAAEVRAVIEAHPEENIKLVCVENGGKANALNIGIDQALHEVIVVLDADAVLDRDAVKHFVPYFRDPQLAAVAGKVCTTSSSGFLDMFQTLEYAIGQNIDKTAFATVGGVGVVPGPAGAWRKSFLKEAGGFHTDTLVEDQEMTIALLHMEKKIAYEPRAIAYTETPHTIENFLKQRFRWVYGTMQCFWKHMSVMVERPFSMMSTVVMPNIFVNNILLPLTYPFADSALLFGLVFGEWRSLVIPFLIFTVLDLIYALWGLRGEPNKLKLMLAVPLQRVVYRQLLYYSVYKALIRAIEGKGTGWNKFAKMGETRRFYLSAMGGVTAALGIEEPESRPVIAQSKHVLGEELLQSLKTPGETALAGGGNSRKEAVSLSVLPGTPRVPGDVLRS